MAAIAGWRDAFIERLKATGNVTPAATGAGVTRQNAYQTRNRNKKFRRLWDDALDQAVDLLDGRGSPPRHGHQARYLLRRRGRGNRERLLGLAAHVSAQGSPADTCTGTMSRWSISGGMDVTGDRKVHVRVRPACRAARPHARRARSRGSRARSRGGTVRPRLMRSQPPGAPVGGNPDIPSGHGGSPDVQATPRLR